MEITLRFYSILKREYSMEILTYTIPDTVAGLAAAILAGIAYLKSKGLWGSVKTLLTTAHGTYEVLKTASSISDVFVNVSRDDWIIFCGYCLTKARGGLTSEEKLSIADTFLKMLAGEDISTIEESTPTTETSTETASTSSITE